MTIVVHICSIISIVPYIIVYLKSREEGGKRKEEEEDVSNGFAPSPSDDSHGPRIYSSTSTSNASRKESFAIPSLFLHPFKPHDRPIGTALGIFELFQKSTSPFRPHRQCHRPH